MLVFCLVLVEVHARTTHVIKIYNGETSMNNKQWSDDGINNICISTVSKEIYSAKELQMPVCRLII